MSKAIVPELARSPAPHAPTAAEPRRRCMGCGGEEHGSIGQHLACLHREIGELAGVMRWSAQHLEGALKTAGASNVLTAPTTTVMLALKSKLRRAAP